MHHTLIVARMAPGAAPDIAKVFAESDGGELPHLVGVNRRSLFEFGDGVYLHQTVRCDSTPVGSAEQNRTVRSPILDSCLAPP
ncbi:TcmI family type II polyketide cyclase, partial [Streptomyces tendae]